MKAVDLITSYQTGAGKVTLDIVVGDGQIGASVVKLNQKEIARDQILGLNLGEGNTLTGKTITVKSVVTDVNDATNKTSISYIFKRGVKQIFQSKAEVDQNGDSIIYRALFRFI